jgi:hypothetical protein
MSLPVPVSMNPKPLSVLRLIVPWGILLKSLRKNGGVARSTGSSTALGRIVTEADEHKNRPRSDGAVAASSQQSIHHSALLEAYNSTQ